MTGLLGPLWALVVVLLGVRAPWWRRGSAPPPMPEPTPTEPGVRPHVAALAGAVLGWMVLWPAPWLAPVGAAVGCALVVRAARTAGRRAEAAAVRALVPTLDLLTLCAGAGLTVAGAVAKVAPRAPPPAGPALTLALDQAARGRRLADALEDRVADLGDASRPLIAALVATERYGSPLAPALERVGDELRAAVRRRAEVAARRLPVTLLFPLVVCILPAFVLLSVVPIVVSALSGLGG